MVLLVDESEIEIEIEMEWNGRWKIEVVYVSAR